MIPTTTPGTGLFLQLVPLLAHRAVLITVSKLDDGDVLQVNLCAATTHGRRFIAAHHHIFSTA